MPGLVGCVTKRPREWAERQLVQMVESLRHESFYVTGTWSDESLGVYVGWISPDRGSAEMVELGRLLKPHGIAVELIGQADAAARAQIEAGGDAVHWHGFVPNAEALRLTVASTNHTIRLCAYCTGGLLLLAGLPQLFAYGSQGWRRWRRRGRGRR